MKRIFLTRGKIALVDDEDFEDLRQFKWRANIRKHGVYAVRSAPRFGGQHGESMHRRIMRAPAGVEVDHVQHHSDFVDNRKTNLRLATRIENNRNRRKISQASSKQKGIYWDKEEKKFRARIKTDKGRKHLGYFSSEKEAAKAYNNAAAKFFGNFAVLNNL